MQTRQKYFDMISFLLILCVAEVFIAIYHPFIRTGIKGVSELNLAIIILLFVCATQIVFYKRKFIIHSHDYFIFAYIFYCLCNALYYTSVDNTDLLSLLISYKHYLNPFIIYFLIKNSIHRRKQASILTYILIIMLVLSSLFGLIAGSIWPHLFTEKGRIVGILNEPNGFGLLIVLLSPLLFLQPRPKHDGLKVIKGMSVFIVMVALLHTGSRGSFVALSLVLGLMFFKSGRKLNIAISGIMISLAIVMFSYFTVFEKQRFLRRINPRQYENLDQYSAGRLNNWQRIVKIAVRKPLFGHGFDTFKESLSKYPIESMSSIVGELSIRSRTFPKRVTSAHNEYLDCFFSLGVVGLFLFLAFQYKIVSHLKKYDQIWIAKACRLGILGFLVNINFVQPFQLRYIYWILIAIILRYIDLCDRKDEAVAS